MKIILGRFVQLFFDHGDVLVFGDVLTGDVLTWGRFDCNCASSAVLGSMGSSFF